VSVVALNIEMPAKPAYTRSCADTRDSSPDGRSACLAEGVGSLRGFRWICSTTPNGTEGIECCARRSYAHLEDVVLIELLRRRVLVDELQEQPLCARQSTRAGRRDDSAT
jgi:hypothetical protein